jgi:O-antigen/teichoic acid export membrane protein
MTLKKIFDNHIIMSGVYKGISGLSLFVTIRLLVDYLGQDNYGLWVLVFTLFQMVLLMDFGIQSTLKTKVPELLQSQSLDTLKAYIKSTYKISIVIACCIFVFFYVISHIINIKSLFNIENQEDQFVNYLFLLNIFFFCLTFIANIHKSLYVAFLKGKYAEESLAVNQFGLLGLTGLLILFFPNVNIQNKLVYLTLVNGLFTFLINVIYTLRFFKIESLNLKTKEKLEKVFFIELIQLGMKFMIIQLCLVIFFSIDNYLIAYFFNPYEVTSYEILNKYFQFPLMIILAMMSPLWSHFTKDYFEGSKIKLLNTFKTFNRLVVGVVVIIALLTMLFPAVLKFWIKDEINTSWLLIGLVGCITLFRIFTSFYTYFLNGIGQLNLYLKIVVISLLIKVPISYFFVSLGLEINGIILSSLIIMVFWILIIPNYSYKIVKQIKNE